jgi:hypothetical protein
LASERRGDQDCVVDRLQQIADMDFLHCAPPDRQVDSPFVAVHFQQGYRPHDLGICLHFQDDPLLNKTVILKPTWGTDAVHRVLDDQQIVTARGKFTNNDLARLWSETKYAGMQDELLRLMMKFQLCYALENEQAYIAPQLLSSDQPTYPWDAPNSLSSATNMSSCPKGSLPASSSPRII